MSVYYGDCDRYFDKAVESLLCQTVAPNQIVIAVDGQVGNELDDAINKVSKLSIVDIIRIEDNIGPGAAKKLAINHTKYPIIAVMDSDDISLPFRFQKQLQLFIKSDLDVVGGWINEFTENCLNTDQVRRVPSSRQEILKRAKWRNPINHVTLMFTKESYDKAGGYPTARYCEDWELIVRMLKTGAKIQNIPEVLVQVRAGSSMINRRQTKKNLSAEITLFLVFYKLNFIWFHELVINISIRVIFKVVPKWFLNYVYKMVLRN
jgi:glycosyltransferase involved in cell wall biosynthesis